MKALLLFMSLAVTTLRGADLLQDDRVYAFGMVPLGTPVHHVFTLKNTGKKVLVIGKITTSCGCTKVTDSPAKIAPGATGSFAVTQLREAIGKADVTIDVPTGPALSDLFTFRVLGLVIEKPTAATKPLEISAKEVLAEIAAKKPVTLVDLRPVSLYVEAHAHLAQSVPPFALATRLDLKSRSIVLINEGVSDPLLVQRISTWQKAGFKDLRILAGGLRAWELAGGSVDAKSRFSSTSAGLVTVDTFYNELKTTHSWLVVSLDNNTANLPPQYLVKEISLMDHSKDFSEQLNQAVEKAKADRVLITSSAGHDYSQVEASLRSSGGITAPVYYLQGGSNLYSVYTRQQDLQLTSQTITVRAQDAFLASNRTFGQVIRGAGCSSCGH